MIKVAGKGLSVSASIKRPTPPGAHPKWAHKSGNSSAHLSGLPLYPVIWANTKSSSHEKRESPSTSKVRKRAARRSGLDMPGAAGAPPCEGTGSAGSAASTATAAGAGQVFDQTQEGTGYASAGPSVPVEPPAAPARATASDAARDAAADELDAILERRRAVND